MNICVFSKKGILYEDITKGSVLGICVPSNDQKRQFADISNPNRNLVKERYGLLEGEVLFRSDSSGLVNAYGVLPKELYDLKNEVKVYLPEDLLPDDISVVYYAIGEHLIVHSVRMLDVEGNISWSSIYIELEKQGAGIVQILENLISERIVSNNDEKILVAYTGIKDSTKENLTQNLSPFVVMMESVDALISHKAKTPIYAHKDNSILMLIFIFMAMILFILSISYYVSGRQTLEKSSKQILLLEQEFKESLAKRRLKQVANPKNVKESIEKVFKARPSAIIHAASEVASLFGVVQSIELDKRKRNRTTRSTENNPEDDVIYVLAQVRTSGKELLVDQERLAKSVYESRKWIRSIERSNRSGDGTLLLKIGVYVSDSGDL